MKHASILVSLLSLALIGCGGGRRGGTTPAGPIGDDPVAATTAARDQMCACQDEGCAERAGERMNAVGDRFGGAKVSDAQSRAISAANIEFDACLARLRGQPEDERVSPPTF